jgi:hypothetical protein
VAVDTECRAGTPEVEEAGGVIEGGEDDARATNDGTGQTPTALRSPTAAAVATIHAARVTIAAVVAQANVPTPVAAAHPVPAAAVAAFHAAHATAAAIAAAHAAIGACRSPRPCRRSCRSRRLSHSRRPYRRS